MRPQRVRWTRGAGLQGDATERAVGSDLTYIATWRGFVRAAFVIDAFSRTKSPMFPGRFTIENLHFHESCNIKHLTLSASRVSATP